MYTQLFLGAAFLIIGLLHFLRAPFALARRLRKRPERARYQRFLALPYSLLGALMIGMGIVERHGLLSTPVFILVYILLAAIPIGLLLYHNRKHFGSFLP